MMVTMPVVATDASVGSDESHFAVIVTSCELPSDIFAIAVS